MTTNPESAAQYRRLFDLLIEAAKVRWTERPSLVFEGRRIDLHKAAGIVSKELGYETELLPHHQQAIDALFDRRQYGYGRTAYNLAHRSHQIASDARLAHFRRAWHRDEA
jgi:hypothetical protein